MEEKIDTLLKLIQQYGYNAIASGIIGYLIYQLKKIYKENSAIKKAVLLLIRDELKEIYMESSKDEDIQFYKSEKFHDFYTEYHALGGNGTVENMKNTIENKKLREGK